jgi:hypothetical protein
VELGGVTSGVYRFSTDPRPGNANALINSDFSSYPRIIPKTAGRILLVIVGAEVGFAMKTSELFRRTSLTGRPSVEVDYDRPVDRLGLFIDLMFNVIRYTIFR